MNQEKFWVYLLKLKRKKGKSMYYVGYTRDRLRRFSEHFLGKGSVITKYYGVAKVVNFWL